jgi:hypothetical protein
MATVHVSPNVNDSQSKARAQQLANEWAQELTNLGSKGDFVISHGNDKLSHEVEGKPFDKGLWIATSPRKCHVFVSENGNPNDFAGAASPSGARQRYRPKCCSCGGGH